MTKEEAITAMKEGKKVRHRFFGKEEWMTIENGKILLEDNVVCDTLEFWRFRTDESWKDGYELAVEAGGLKTKICIRHNE